MPEFYEDQICVSADLDAIDMHDQVNKRLVGERAAGTPRILEDLMASSELTQDIEGARVGDEEVITLLLDARKHKILTISRRLGPRAVTRPILQ